jgi:hypothetical protein
MIRLIGLPLSGPDIIAQPSLVTSDKISLRLLDHIFLQTNNSDSTASSLIPHFTTEFLFILLACRIYLNGDLSYC